MEPEGSCIHRSPLLVPILSQMSPVLTTLSRFHFNIIPHIRLDQPCPTRRPRYTFLAPSVSTLFEPIININSNFKTKKFLNI
jgi:hypothetical protein